MSRLMPIFRLQGLLCLVHITTWTLLRAEEAEPVPRWSAQALERLLGENGSAPGAVKPGREHPEPTEGLLLKTYQLHTLRVGEAGRSRIALQVLGQLLPPGSSMKEDAQANSLHLLTTARAHAAAWDFISAIDVAQSGAPQPDQGGPALAEGVREALRQLSELTKRSATMAGAVEQVLGDLAQAEEASSARQRALLRNGALGCSAFLLFVCLTVLMARRWLSSRARADQHWSLRPRSSTGERQESSDLSLSQQKLQQEMMGVLNAAAIRMESWYGEQKHRQEEAASSMLETRNRMLADNEAVLRQVGSRIEVTACQLETNVQLMAVQNTRVDALAGELATAVKELDSTRDEFVKIQVELERKSTLLDSTRDRLSHRESELAQQQAKLAALTLILEEGGWPSEGANNDRQKDTTKCTTKKCEMKREPEPALRHRATVTFRFLPPDHPES